jgi:hypothetical protein
LLRGGSRNKPGLTGSPVGEKNIAAFLSSGHPGTKEVSATAGV